MAALERKAAVTGQQTGLAEERDRLAVENAELRAAMPKPVITAE